MQKAGKLTGVASISERLENVQERLMNAALRSQRSPSDITLVAITKTHPVETIREAIELGVINLGENRVQEAEDKIPNIEHANVQWHLVGHLQSNKARRAVALFDVIHSVDSGALARRLDRHCEEEGKAELSILVQVDLAGEKTKSGVDAKDLNEVLETIGTCSRLRLFGLMTLPPYFTDPECTRPFFKALRELRDDLRNRGHFGDLPGELSMGMSHDFEVAIEEGASMIRVGTAIFGERS